MYGTCWVFTAFIIRAVQVILNVYMHLLVLSSERIVVMHGHGLFKINIQYTYVFIYIL